MTMSFSPDTAARQVLAALRQRGFEHAQVTVSDTRRCELNLAHNEPSLLRSNEARKLSATGIVGGRRAFNYAGGSGDALTDVPARFGIERMMRELTQQVHTRPLAERFVGDVVLAPGAVGDLLSWLMGQLRDGPLIDGSSLFRNRVGDRVASPLLTLRSRYDAPGCAPLSADAFVTPAVTLLDAGHLTQLTPSPG